MTVASTTRKAGPFSGNGTQTAFPFSFKIYTKNDIAVTLTTSAGISSTLVLDSDYSVSVNANQDTSPGGTVTYPISGTALPTGSTLTISGNLAYSQTTQLPSGGAYNAANVEAALDRLTILSQQLLEATGRSLALPVSVASGVSGTLPVPAASKFIGWNETATALQNVDAQTLATIVAFGTANADIFTGTGSQTLFTLSANPGAQANLDVSVGGVTQLPGVDYNWSGGTTVTFTTAPPLNAKVLIRYFQGLPQGTTDSAASTYTQGGTGSVTRSVQTKLRETVSVTDFGAKGDGVTDDTAAIQAAINACSATGKTLYAPAGTYRLNSGLSITNAIKGGFTLSGDGWSTIDASFNTESGTRFYYYGSGTAFTVAGTVSDNVENVTLRGFSIENKSGSTGSTIGLRTNNTRWNEFTDLYVAGFNIGIDHNNLSYVTKFSRCLVYNNATYGINNQSDGEDSLFENCFVRYNGVAGVIVNQAKNDTFVVCDFGNNPKGLVLYGGNSGSASQVTCIGCIWEDNTTSCIDINTAGLSAPYYPQLNLIGGRMYNSGLGGTKAINAVIWNQINIVGTECNFTDFVNTTGGAGNYGPIFIQGVKFLGTNLLNGDKTALRQAGSNTGTRTAVANGSMSNSWTNHAENSVYYWKDWNNVIHLGGQVQGGTIGTIVFTLPAGFRPAAVSRFSVASNGAFGECYIDAGGQVYALVGNNTRFSFEGITFYAGN